MSFVEIPSPPWKDTTTYRQGQLGAARIPRTWQLKFSGLRLVVHRHQFHDPDVWLTSCHPGLFTDYVLSSRDSVAAKFEALQVLRRWLEARLHLVIEAIERTETP